VNVEKNKLFPDIQLNYFLGSNAYPNARYYHGFEAGLAVPLFFNAGRSKIKASEISHKANLLISGLETDKLKIKEAELHNAHIKYKELLELHDTSGNRLVNEIFRTAQLSFENGMIDYTKFAASIETALQIKLDYFDNVFKYNQATLELNYLSE
jgi:cobalt-zinc-cadmium resistance protein CzcA